ncbi:adhesion G-protein coupled receptor G5 [Sphaerodactylus townsendi]|uniref:adhesion G-protein coupled receptor G5 n=1 Tax=Sphaerodactylus townsendi TaxID=933632 RepID=UPI0020261882|nr:adhesion G-protein coupled receptor G5 [Sphaerodactylus townsendi]XP_048371794.1 adhesion G-protein coupled receptor G5 [Sphaerodactylus townsendi]
MDPGLWICLFACATFPAQLTGLKPSKEAVVQNSSSDGEVLGKYAIEEAMETFKGHLAGGCVSKGKELVRAKQNLEKTLQEANMSQENLIVAHEDVQTLIFRIKPKDFRGLNISSDLLKVTTSIKNQTRHSMSFPTALTERARALPANEMRLTCVYLKASCLFQDEKNSSLLNNDILGATLGDVKITNLSQPVEIRFWHNLRPVSNYNMTCVFWMEGREEGTLGTWSPADCNTIFQEGIVICQCYHLTYFAVLLQISPPPLDEGLLDALTYITSIGCSVSAAACLLTACLYLCSRKKQHNPTTKIHVNLLVALFFLKTSFLVSGPLASVTSSQPCQVAAAFLHYSLLCGLTWMALEGFHLYMLVIRVYNVYIRHYLLKLCAAGWGLPCLMVMVIFLINKEVYGIHQVQTSHSYSNRTMCWITSIKAHYFNLIYVSGAVLFNMIVLMLVVWQLRQLGAKSCQQKEHSCRDLVTVLGLTCLLGTTWALAFVSFGVFSIPQLFLFTILNALQGLFICLWCCALRCRSQESGSGGTSRPSQ